MAGLGANKILPYHYTSSSWGEAENFAMSTPIARMLVVRDGGGLCSDVSGMICVVYFARTTIVDGC